MIYFDNNATTCVDKEVAEKAYHFMTNVYGNPSSLHDLGMAAYQALGDARYLVARMIGAKTRCMFFTSGGTESNNIAIQGAAEANRTWGKHIVTTAIEHSSVLECCKALEQKGFEITYVKPNPSSHAIEADDIIKAVRKDTVLVTAMQVNNETGELLPLADIVEGIRKKNPLTNIHCDAIQGYGKIPFKIHEYDVDFMSASAHKIHGPKGVGVLYIKEGRKIVPLQYGGSQEGKINPGTENVPLACAFGLAADKKLIQVQENMKKVALIKDYMKERLLKEIPIVHLNGPEHTSPYVLNFSIPGNSSSEMVDYFSMRDIYVSAGSACSKDAISHVLQAEGYDISILSSALRVSFCEHNSIDEVNVFIEALKQKVEPAK
jgi:cysteine desulfurase